MLVLALQFSRGDVTHAEPPEGGSTQRRRKGRKYRDGTSGSFKTEEKTVAGGDVAREEGPNP
jgi:hypothetical protein